MTAARTHGALFALAGSVIEELYAKIYIAILQCVVVRPITVGMNGRERDVFQKRKRERYNPMEMWRLAVKVEKPEVKKGSTSVEVWKPNRIDKDKANPNCKCCEISSKKE